MNYISRIIFYLVIFASIFVEIGVLGRFFYGLDLTFLLFMVLSAAIFTSSEDALIVAFVSGLIVDVSGMSRFLWATLCYLTIVILVIILKRNLLDFTNLLTQVISVAAAALILQIVDFAVLGQFSLVIFLLSLAANVVIGLVVLFVFKGIYAKRAKRQES